jgi:CheY-like chemotaxis protein/nitrogen-specific signal transduction histidine kinase
VLNIRDVTERKRAEAVLVRSKEQAEEVARLKSAFLANMSHEIRTPLTGILGFTSVLAEEITDPQQQEFVSLIEKSGRRLMDTLNSVLELARLEAGRVELSSESVRLADAAQEAAGLMAPMASEKGLRLEARILAPTAEAQLDRAALDRVLTNLVGNAVKFTEEGGVVIEVDADEHAVFLRVIDTGVGIDPGFVPRLFYDFEQESTGIGRSHEGSGLGLAISRQLVERMRGSIAVDSSKGQGTTFSVTFPRYDVDPDATETLDPGMREPRKRILVVDDNLNTRNLMERMLCGHYDVTIAGDANSALRAADEGPPFAAVLLDINLGGDVSGEEVMRRLRKTDAYGQSPIMAFTAYALPGDRARFLHTGFSGYLAKPFTRVQLLEAVAELFGDEAPADFGGDGAWQDGLPAGGTLPADSVTASDVAPDDGSAGTRAG